MKPLTLEEAKANIGKEVVYIGEHMSAKKDFANHEATIAKVLPNSDFVDVRMKKRGVSILTWRVGINDLSLKQPLKIGDTVKLDPSTKPYTQLDFKGNVRKKVEKNLTQEVFKVKKIHKDGDIDIVNIGWISPHHLIKVEEETMTADQLIKRNTVQDATHIGVKSKLFSIVLDETRFLWINGQWIECHSIDDDFEPVTIGIDTGEKNPKSIISTLTAQVDVDVNVNVKSKKDEPTELNLPNGRIIHGNLVNNDKPQYTPKEIELRERIAFKLLEQRSSDQSKIGEKTDLIFKIITGK